MNTVGKEVNAKSVGASRSVNTVGKEVNAKTVVEHLFATMEYKDIIANCVLTL